MPELESPRTALITGAARRIGRAIALDLAAHGWRVGLHYRHSRQDAERLADEIRTHGGTATALAANLAGSDLIGANFDFDANLFVGKNSDGSVTAELSDTVGTSFMRIAGHEFMKIRVKSTAVAASQASSGTCIWSLGNSGQDVLINSGATVQSTQCRLDAYSTANPAFIMNSGATIKFTKFCVKGTNYIKNGGTLANLETGCAVTSTGLPTCWFTSSRPIRKNRRRSTDCGLQ